MQGDRALAINDAINYANRNLYRWQANMMGQETISFIINTCFYALNSKLVSGFIDYINALKQKPWTVYN